MTTTTNWSGNYIFNATRLHRPGSLDELRSIVAKAPKIHAIGSHHSFNDIADSAELIDLGGLDQRIEIDRSAGTATVPAGIRYSDLADHLVREGVALHNMASLPHITVAGAVATATHGSGDKSGNLATAVTALELVTSDGDLHSVSHSDSDFSGMVVGIGALGVLTRITLAIEPAYLMQQEVIEHLEWEALFDSFDAVTSAADSVSLFTDFGDTVNQVWLKHRLVSGQARPRLTEFMGAAAATKQLNPVVTLTAENCTEQLGVPGSWSDRLPHIRLQGVTANGDQLQSEYMVSRESAIEALRAIRALAPLIQPHLWISEIRTVAADQLWLSSAYQRDTVCIHFSFKNEPEAVSPLLPAIESALAPFEPRPHWGKLFVADSRELETRYPRFDDFRSLAGRLDQRGAFRNAFLDRCLFG